MTTPILSRGKRQSNGLPKKEMKHISQVRSAIFVVAALIVWELIFKIFTISPLILVPPSSIAGAFVRLLTKDGVLLHHTYVSLTEFAQGYVLSAVVGIIIGLILGVSKTLRDYLDVTINALYSAPIIAISPLLIMWFGIGMGSKVAVCFSLAVFPILINTMSGVQSVENNFLETAKCFGLSRIQTFTKVLMPAALPFIITGLRLGVGRALIGVVVGEFFGARAGLGYLIYSSSQVFDTATVLVGVLIFAILGVIGTELLKTAEAKIAPWRRPASAE